MAKYTIAVIPGDGIGKEVVPAAMSVLERTAARFDISLAWDELDWSCDSYVTSGRLLPDDGLERIAGHEPSSWVPSVVLMCLITSPCGGS